MILGQHPPEIAYWGARGMVVGGRGEAGHPEALTVVSDRLVFKP